MFMKQVGLVCKPKTTPPFKTFLFQNIPLGPESYRAFEKLAQSKEPITWRISARAKISVRLAGWNFVAITWRISARADSPLLYLVLLKTNQCACPSAHFYPGDLAFQSGLKYYSDCMRFFSPFSLAETFFM